MFGCRSKHQGSRRGDAARPGPRRTEDTIAFVEQHLGITAGQREAWENLTETMRDSAEAMHIARGAVDQGAPGALQRFAGFETVAETASAAFRRIRPALEGLYRSLDVAQRRALDELITRRPPHFHGAGF